MHRCTFLGPDFMKNFLFTATALLLCSCGFHLKGSHSYDRLPQKQWHIVGNSLQQPLENALRDASGMPVAAAQTNAVLRISALETQKDIYTITRAAKLNEYLLVLRVQAQAYHNGKAWGEPMAVEVRRVMPYADSLVLGKQEEEQTIWQEMQNDAAAQIVRRLAFLPEPQ